MCGHSRSSSSNSNSSKILKRAVVVRSNKVNKINSNNNSSSNSPRGSGLDEY